MWNLLPIRLTCTEASQTTIPVASWTRQYFLCLMSGQTLVSYNKTWWKRPSVLWNKLQQLFLRCPYPRKTSWCRPSLYLWLAHYLFVWPVGGSHWIISEHRISADSSYAPLWRRITIIQVPLDATVEFSSKPSQFSQARWSVYYFLKMDFIRVYKEQYKDYCQRSPFLSKLKHEFRD